jgi:hypothetical protein
MKEFLFVFRADWNQLPKGSPEEMQARTKKWMDWIGGIASQNKLVDRGNRLFPEGKVLKAEGVITDGPYLETKEFIGGYSIVKAESYEKAIDLAAKCPVLTFGGNIEIREVSVL